MLRLKNSLVWKLTIWFLLLAIFPIVVMMVFVRQNIQEELLHLARQDAADQANLLAARLSAIDHPADPPALHAVLRGVTNLTGVASVVDHQGVYLTPSESTLAGNTLADSFGPALAQQILSGPPKGSFDTPSQVVGFAAISPNNPNTSILILAVDRSIVASPMGRIERSALFQIAVSLIIVCVAGGTVIWVMFNPIQKLTRAAEAVGGGNLAIHVDTSDMEGELEVLTHSFNQMTRQLREAHDELEQRVEARTEELRESREAERRLAEENTLLTEIGRIISSTLEINEVYDRFSLEVKKLVNFDRMAINVLNPDGETFTFKYATGPVRPGRPVPDIRPLKNTQTGQIVRSGRPLLIANVGDAPQFTGTPEYLGMGLHSSVMVPLISKGKVIGSMSLRSRQPGAYGEREQHILQRLANQIAPSIENSELYAQTRAAEEALRASEARYRTLFEQSTDAIFVASEGRIVEANQAAAAMFGYSLAEVIGLDVEQVYVHSEDRARFREEIYRKGSVRDFEVKMYKKSGEEIDCLLTAALQRANAGTNLGIQGVIRDITEWKQAEEVQLQQTRELAVLEERNRMAREIHDTLAQGFTGIVLQMEAAEQAVETRPEEVTAHLSQAKSLARESLQEARRSVWNLLPQALEQLPLPEALEEEVHRSGVNAGWSRADFSLSGKPRDLPSPIQTGILRVCQESLSNIMKHANASEVTVNLAFHREGVNLSVRDNGRGFDPHQPGPVTQQGGFGLTGMKQRAALMHGELTIQSEPGRGTLVEIQVPTGVTSG